MTSLRRAAATGLLAAGLVCIGLAPAGAADGPLDSIIGENPITTPVDDLLEEVLDPPGGGPTVPTEEEPTLPGEEEPTEPGEEEPTLPGEEEPTEPGEEEPTEPGEEEPTDGLPPIDVPVVDLPTDSTTPPGQDPEFTPPGQVPPVVAPQGPGGGAAPTGNPGINVPQPAGEFAGSRPKADNFACYDPALCGVSTPVAAPAVAQVKALPETGASDGMFLFGFGGVAMVLAGLALLRQRAPRALHRA